jgi:uncharacterized short protein YbdD (DUF466 family)
MDGTMDRVWGFGRYVCQCARLMVGLPDYEAYVAHMRTTHPDQAPLTYEEFFRERQQARYGAGRNGGLRCCYPGAGSPLPRRAPVL